MNADSSGVKIVGVKRRRGRPPKNKLAGVTYLMEKENSGVSLLQGTGEKDASKRENFMVKRKITTHYVPPDMLAIKMLFENYGEKVDVLENMSDEDVVMLKENLLKELSNYEDK